MRVALLSQESARRAGEAEKAHGDDARHADLEGGHALGERFGAKVRALKLNSRRRETCGGLWGQAGMLGASCFA